MAAWGVQPSVGSGETVVHFRSPFSSATGSAAAAGVLLTSGVAAEIPLRPTRALCTWEAPGRLSVRSLPLAVSLLGGDRG